jgi:hypothetical protein
MKINLSLLLLVVIIIFSLSCNKEKEDINDGTLKIPSVKIDNITNITTQSAHIIGNVTDNGNASVNSRGVCWSKDKNPSLDNFTGINTNEQGLGVFISEVLGLEENTQYYFCAYAINEKGIGYSDVQLLTTLELSLANVSTNEPTNIEETSVSCGGTINNNGNSEIISKGVCWSKSNNPSLENNLGFTQEGNGDENFISSINNLSSLTTYYVRAYAINIMGTSYGESISFTTSLDVPVVSSVIERFSNVTLYEEVSLVGWTNVSTTNTNKWYATKTGSNNRHALMWAEYDGPSYIESWLITPIVSDISSKTLSVSTCQEEWMHNNYGPLQVLISTNYNGSNFESANWQYLTDLNIADYFDGNGVWVNSGDYSLSDYSGNAAIAFVYSGGNFESTVYRIDNILIR